MKLLMRKLKKRYVITVLAIICGFAVLQLAPVVKAATTGTSQTIYDSTYIDQLVIDIKSSNEELKKQIAAMSVQTDLEKKLADTQKELTDMKDSVIFQKITLPAGKTLIGGASTEIIVRSPKVIAYVDSKASGNLLNVSTGKDIKNGADVPVNQLQLVLVADGRGITAKANAYIMVKGTYTIK